MGTLWRFWLVALLSVAIGVQAMPVHLLHALVGHSDTHDHAGAAHKSAATLEALHLHCAFLDVVPGAYVLTEQLPAMAFNWQVVCLGYVAQKMGAGAQHQPARQGRAPPMEKLA